MGLQTTLQELRLADNLLGDNLNPIFSTSEFHGLGQLRLLDLSGNLIKGIEEGILKGCENLQVQLWYLYRVLFVLCHLSWVQSFSDTCFNNHSALLSYVVFHTMKLLTNIYSL